MKLTIEILASACRSDDDLRHRTRQARIDHRLHCEKSSSDYTDLLQQCSIDISMSRKGNPWDNAACESFMKMLRYEDVHRNEHRDLAGARASIQEFLEKVYSRQRLHSTLGYVPPRRSFWQTSPPRRKRMLLRVCFLYEFSRASEKLPIRWRR